MIFLLLSPGPLKMDVWSMNPRKIWGSLGVHFQHLSGVISMILDGFGGF